MVRLLLRIASLLLILAPAVSAAAQTPTITCGVAIGYPPYQFTANGLPAGMDVEVLRETARVAGLSVRWQQLPWDDVVGLLRRGRLDCATGMEITPQRQGRLLFTSAYYQRRNMVFLRADRSEIRSTADLVGKIVSGDRDSTVEAWLHEHGLKERIRMPQLASKDESMQQLRNGGVVAAIMPEAVGYHLARQYDVPVRVLNVVGKGAPVAFAIAPGRTELQWQLEIALGRVRASGTLNKLLSPWGVKPVAGK